MGRTQEPYLSALSYIDSSRRNSTRKFCLTTLSFCNLLFVWVMLEVLCWCSLSIPYFLPHKTYSPWLIPSHEKRMILAWYWHWREAIGHYQKFNIYIVRVCDRILLIRAWKVCGATHVYDFLWGMDLYVFGPRIYLYARII